MSIEIFNGHECEVIQNASLKLLLSRSIGPRILSLSAFGGENLFAELPNFITQLPDGRIFHFYGGHRLWHAPEELNVTYLPDDTPVELMEMENGFLAVQETEKETKLQKSMGINVHGDEAKLTITHRIFNHGDVAVNRVPWAITQFKLGGLAILPQNKVETRMLPNRSLALWPYTQVSNPHVTWGSNYILVDGTAQDSFKIGFPNPRGWLAYWLNGTLFVKRADFDAQASYYDFGSSSEFYCNDQFLELETLAPIKTLQPKSAATHVETWELYANIERPQNEDEVQALVEKLALEG